MSPINRRTFSRFAVSMPMAGLVIPAAVIPVRAQTPTAEETSFDVPVLLANPARTGAMPGPGPEYTNGVEAIWTTTFESGPAIDVAPVIVGNQVVVGTVFGSVAALDRSTGAQMWRMGNFEPISATPAVGDGIVVVGDSEAYLRGYDIATGDLRWEATGLGITSAPATAKGKGYVGSSDHHLYAFHLADGIEYWRYGDAEGSSWGETPVSIADNTLYAGDLGGAVHALDADLGLPKWRYQTTSWAIGATAVADGVVFALGRDGTVHALDAADGSSQWQHAVGAETWGYIAVADGTLYVGDEEGRFHAIDAATGDFRWKTPLTQAISSAPVVAGNIVYVGSDDGYIHALDIHTGDVLWQFLLDGSPSASLAVTDGLVYVGSGAGTVYAIGAKVPRLEPGARATVNTEAALRAAPAISGVERATLAEGDIVEITGDAVDDGTVIWWPVTVPDTGDQGWVDGNHLTPGIASS